tara:strand:+ start:128 stop:574 length:447 start_codon:yes stop_codon:yes gene_type:complete
MRKVIQIGICKKSSEKIHEVQAVEVISGKGIVNDRHFDDHNDDKNQITLIEKENIDHYNNEANTNISYIDFRRNIVTAGIKLNDLIGKKIKIGSALVEGVDLCKPCKHLQEMIGQSDLVKKFLLKGGLRCKIISSGKIQKNDQINIDL